MIALSLLPSLCPSGGSRVRKDLGSRALKDLTSRQAVGAKLWEETREIRPARDAVLPRATGGRRAPSTSSSTPTTRASRRRRRGSSSCSPPTLRKFGGLLRPQHQASAAATPTSCCCRCCARALRCASARARRRRWPTRARTTPLRPRWRSWRARPTLTSGPSRRCGSGRSTRAQSSGAVSLDAAVPAAARAGLRLHLRCRRGLEAILADGCASTPSAAAG